MVSDAFADLEGPTSGADRAVSVAARPKTATPWTGPQLAFLRRNKALPAREAAAALSGIGPARTRGAVHRMRERMRRGEAPS